MAYINNIPGADGPQYYTSLSQLGAALDDAALESLLPVADPVDGLGRGQGPDLTKAVVYDRVKLQALVEDLWPPPLPGKRRMGRRMFGRLPVVCAVLRVCDPIHGSIHNLSAEILKLRKDEEYRKKWGFSGGVPSRSVFETTYQKMLSNWARFRECAGPLHDGSDSPGGHEITDALLLRVGWEDNIPPLFRANGQVPTRLNGAAGDKSGESLEVHVVDSASSNGKEPGESGQRKVYARDWHLYNWAQVNEGQDFLSLLGGLGDLLNLVESRYRSNCGRGRPRFPLGPILFALACKAYYGLSSRRLHSQLELAAGQGYLRALPPDVFDARSDDAFNLPDEAVDSPIPRFNTVCYYLRADWMTPVLLELVTVSATPVRGLETAFAVDGTGWSTHPFERWLDHRLEVETVRHGWVKLHIISGDLTNVISRAVISPSNHHDNPYFRELVTSTAQHFKMSKVQADMAYSSRVNYDLVRRLGAELYVPFKSNTVPVVDDGSAWSDALQFFNNFPDAFNDEYHQRSNVESTNSALKRKFPAQLRSKAFSGHVNEILCKIIAYNLGVVGREMRMRGVVPDFPKEVYMLENSIKVLNEESRALAA